MTRSCCGVALFNDASTSCAVFSSSSPITYSGAISFTLFHFITHHNNDMSAVYSISYAIKPTNGCRQKTTLKCRSTGRRQSRGKTGRQGGTMRSVVKTRDSLESHIRRDTGEVNAYE